MIQYIGPSLEKHKGCDILDLNPGAGLWSQKLHEFLQPRSHILLEPEPDRYDRYLRPLLEEPGSKYKLFMGDAADFSTFNKLVEEGAFPHQKRVEAQSPLGRELNHSLLVTGSLVWDPKLPGLGFDSMSRQIFHWLVNTAWEKTGIHAFGHVRSLLWMMQEDVRQYLPRCANQYAKAASLNTWSKFSEVVTPGHIERGRLKLSPARRPRYEIESVVRAMRNGRAGGMELPIHRRENVHDFAEEIEARTKGTGIMNSVDLMQYLKEQEMAGKSTAGLSTDLEIRNYKTEKALLENPDIFKTERVDTRGRMVTGVTKEGKDASQLRATVNRNLKIMIETEKHIDLAEDIYNLECKILGLGDGPSKEAALRKLEDMERELDGFIGKTTPVRRTAIINEIDDRLALRSPVPRLQWDSRPYEPLIMQPGEVWPAARVSLLDSEPRPPLKCDPSLPLTRLLPFVRKLADYPQSSVVGALEAIQPGAGELVEQVSSLKDPKKGGRLNMNNLRVRMLTKEMVAGLWEAYEQWPFKHQM